MNASSLLKLCAALLVVTGGATFAQTESRLTATISDSSGSVVVGAEVTALNTATGVVTRALSNDTGTYVLPSLPPGPYKVACQLAGFKRAEQEGIVLDTGFVRTVDFRLDLGDVTETV